MIDIHCHILPNFDDGAENLEESMAMARMAVASGVTGIVATPHFNGDAAAFRRLGALMGRYEKLEQVIRQSGLPLELYPGAEILCLPQTPQLAQKKVLPTIADTNYLLVEFRFDEPHHFMTDMLDALAQAGYRPVVAHPERYRAVQRNPNLPRYWFDMGYVLQVNKGSLLGSFGTHVQHSGEQIVGQGLAHLIASDAHGTATRTPHMGALKRWVQEHCDPAYARILLEENPKRLVQGAQMAPVESVQSL